MRIYILTILSIVLLISCKTDPNKQVDEGTVKENVYHSKEIGWTIEIPKGWKVTQREESQKREDNGLKAINEANGINYDASGLKQLISFQKDRFHIFQSTSEKFEIEYDGEYEENKILVKELLYDTYASNGIKVDTISSTEKIDNLNFDLFKITVYDPKGKIMLYQDLYSTFRNGVDFGVNLNYINEKEKMELMSVWKNSKFE
jgi:ribosomal protein L25 (general stress protein Ctc)